MKLSLLVLALVVGQLCFADEATTQAAVKNGTGAPGRYRGQHHKHNRGGYGHDEYNYRTPVIDDYICDLEATVLVVSSKHHVKEEKSYGGDQSYGGNQGYGQNNYGNQGGYEQNNYGGGNQGGGYGQNNYGGGNQGGSYDQNNYGGGNQPGYGQNNYGSGNQPGYDQNNYGGNQGGYEKPKKHEYATPEALRLKCSHIAVHSEHDCQTCCKLSARRYHSVSKNDIFGFIIDASEIKYDGKGYVRSKRSTGGYGQQSSPGYQQPNYGGSPSPNYESSPTQAYEQPQGYGGSSSTYEASTPGYSQDSGYQGGSSYSPSNYGHYGPPKNARCVCCAPKRHHHESYHKRRHYDRSESNEY
jgi:hypothetical protein